MRNQRYTATPETLTEGKMPEHTLVDAKGRLITVSAQAVTPPDATMVQTSSGNVANASAAAAIAAGGAAVMGYCTGFQVTGAGATTGLPVIVTLAGIAGGTLSFIHTFPAGVLVPCEPLVVKFDPPIPASALNTAITLTVPAGGAGNTHSCATIQGFRV